MFPGLRKAISLEYILQYLLSRQTFCEEYKIGSHCIGDDHDGVPMAMKT